MNTFLLKITSSKGCFYEGQCESIILPTEGGEYVVLANHEFMVIGIMPGAVKYKVDGEWKEIAVGQGYARSETNRLYMVVTFAERPEDIDEIRALHAKERAEERMQVKNSRREYYRGQLAMTRAMARLKVKEDKYNI